MGGGHHAHVGGGPRGFVPPHYPRHLKIAGTVLAVTFWSYVLYMAKNNGPYHFGFRKPWVDHAPSGEYMAHHEQAWKEPPASRQ